jgi:hypothetical protein
MGCLLYRISSSATVVHLTAVNLIFASQGYSGSISHSTYTWLAYLSLLLLAGTIAGTFWTVLRWHKMPWIGAFTLLCCALALAIPDPRGPSRFVQDAFGFALPPSAKVVRDERGVETFLECTLSPADGEALLRQGIAGHTNWHSFEASRFFGPLDGARYRGLLCLEYSRDANGLCLIGYDPAHQKLLLVRL